MKLSIIVPNYNNSKYLNDCLDSILSQTYKDLEIIIVDDYSIDNSLDIIQDYAKRDKRIKVIKNKSNYGISKTRDIGIKESSANWITTLDSDDYYLTPIKIEKEMELISKYNCKHIIAYSGIVHIDEMGNKLKKIMSKLNIKEGYVFEDMITRNFAIPRDFIFSKDLYNDIGGFDYNIPLYEDWDLKVRLSKKAQFYYSGIDGIAYRQHGKGLSSAKYDNHIKWVKYIFEKNTKGLKNKANLELILKKNFNFNLPLDDTLKIFIVNDLINQIKELNITSFSIFGVGELTNLFLIKLALENIYVKINFIVTSQTEKTINTYYEKSVVSPKEAIKNGENNFILASYNNLKLLEELLRKECMSKKLNIIKTNIKGI